MKNNRQVFSGIPVFFFLALTLFYVSAHPSSRFFQRTNLLRIESLAKQFDCMVVEDYTDRCSLKLKNNYDKTIAGYAYQLGTNHGRVRHQRSIAPGQTYLEQGSIPRNWLEEAKPDGLTLTILAIIFDDDTGDGAPEVIKEFQDVHAGTRLQAARIHSLLDNYLTRSDDDLPNSLSILISGIGNLEESEGSGKSFAYATALHDEKERAIATIKELEGMYKEQGNKLYEKFGKDIIRRRLTQIRDEYK